MAPDHPTPAPGNPAGGPPAPPPPLDPRAMDALLRLRPDRAAVVLVSMRPPQRRAQLLAHAEAADAPPEDIEREWADLLRSARPADLNDPLPASVIEPETLALAEPDEARRLIAALSPEQRVRQAVAQGAWLARFGYDVSMDEILAAWEPGEQRAAA